jgi:hypothetical protein
MARINGQRLFVCEALSHQSVALEHIGQHVLVRYRNMYLRELDLATGTTRAFIYPVSHLSDQVLPMS